MTVDTMFISSKFSYTYIPVPEPRLISKRYTTKGLKEDSKRVVSLSSAASNGGGVRHDDLETLPHRVTEIARYCTEDSS